MTFSHTRTSTFTEARVREVMKSVFDELVGAANLGFISLESAHQWRDDLTYMLFQQVLEYFELQFRKPDGTRVGFRYEVSDDGSLLEASRSGGQRLYMLPDGTRGSILVSFREGHLDPEMDAELTRRGWGSGGSSLQGEGTRDRAYSDQGYGLIRKRMGDW
ncbi:hypothetical protein JY651_50440 [Pyxidicoccus parkwayensis]|uniref:Bacterial HORMA domain-containing protein n=1 Tax=Pyxidicoccus parkwayensis TaxID=2813578 RepID=A0ABX7NXP4_9BACT|nr:hypothetical protein [Pyxidicoccus parkwaysis]QSQ23211.1 hypothetical protein JY651_50440 [Pyxidicoccus parkwaysis]